MNTEGGKNEAILLECVQELNAEKCSDLQSIQSKMLELHNINHEETEAVVNTLKDNNKLSVVERIGFVQYVPVQPQTKLKRSRSIEAKQTSVVLTTCLKAVNQANENAGASLDDILKWLQSNDGPSALCESEQLQKALDDEVSFMKIKRTNTGMYIPAKKRGRPSGSPSSSKLKAPKLAPAPAMAVRSPVMRSTSLKSAVIKRSPDETGKRPGNLGKRRRIKKSSDDFEFYDTPGNTSMQAAPSTKTEPICDFCLKSASCNRLNKFEELLLCKDCNAKAHPSCMGYSEILARRASVGAWQCIDCKTCCRCLESGDPDDLLFCDACDKGYHIFCHEPSIKEKPKNKWACQACMNDGVTTEDLLTNSPVDDPAEAAATTSPTTQPAVNETSSTNDQTNQSDAPTEAAVQATAVAKPPTPGTPGTPATPSADVAQPPVSPPKIILPEVPSHWTVTHVSQYIQQCGFPAEAQRFYEQEIDGKSFMLLMRQDVLCNMNLKLGPALKIYEKIKVLQKGPAVRSHQH